MTKKTKHSSKAMNCHYSYWYNLHQSSIRPATESQDHKSQP